LNTTFHLPNDSPFDEAQIQRHIEGELQKEILEAPEATLRCAMVKDRLD